VYATFVYATGPCGSGLAREDAGTPSIEVTDLTLSRASPLPHWISGVRSLCVRPRTLWERACPRRRRHTQYRSDWPSAFASKPAPTLDLRCTQPLCTPSDSVGASLLAMLF